MKVAIIGAGKFGLNITEALLGGGHEITIIDKDETKLQKASGQYDIFAVNGNAKQIEVLKDVGIESYDLLISCTDDDEKNIVICAFAKALGCRTVIARVRDPEHAEQFDFVSRTLHIDHIVNPDMACAAEIYKYLTEKYALEGGRIAAGGVAILEFELSKIPQMGGKKLTDAARYLDDGILVGAVSRSGKIIVPNGGTELSPQDTLYVIGAEGKINRMRSRVHDNKKNHELKRVMIAGGGKTGYFLAKKLSAIGVAVKIIETNRARCEYLSDNLEGVLILHGDATDLNLLKEERFDNMDAFVAVTGFDEENLLLSLMAKQHDIKDVVAKVSHKNYNLITENLGVSMTINPMDISTSNILRFLQKDDSVVFSQIVQGQAEFVEIRADRSMPLTEKTLADLDIPQGVLIAAIHRGGEVIIPTGRTRIAEGDQVIILSLLSSMPSLEGLLNKGRSHTM